MRHLWLDTAATAASWMCLWVILTEFANLRNETIKRVTLASIVVPVSCWGAVNSTTVAGPASEHVHCEVIMRTQCPMDHRRAIVRATIGDVRRFDVNVDHVFHGALQ